MVNLLKEDLQERVKIIDSFVEFCLDKGWASEAIIILDLGASAKSVDNVIKFLLKEKIYHYYLTTSIKVAKKGASTSMIDYLTDHCIKENFFNQAVEIAELGASLPLVENLAMVCINKGRIDNAKKSVKLRGRNFSQEEIDSLMLNCVNREEAIEAAAELRVSAEIIDTFIEESINEGFAETVIKATKLRGRPLSIEEIDRLVEVCMGKWTPCAVIEAAKLGASDETLKSTLDFFVKRGNLEEAFELTKLIGRSLLPEEIDFMLASSIAKGYIERSFELVKLRDRDLTKEEMDLLLETVIKDGRIGGAIYMAELLKRDLSINEMKNLFDVIRKRRMK